MVFNLQKFLVKNKLTERSKLNEEDNTGGMIKTDAEKEEMGAEEGDEEMYDPDVDNPYATDHVTDDMGRAEPWPTQRAASDTEKDIDKEPAPTSVRTDRTTKNLQTKELKLKALEDQKDALLMQLKSGQLSLDQYKAAIGNIPNQIKKLRVDIQQALEPELDDEELV